MAQIKVLPHHHPARYLNYISQAWIDFPVPHKTSEDGRAAGGADEIQVKKNKLEQAGCYNFSYFVQDKGWDLLSEFKTHGLTL